MHGWCEPASIAAHHKEKDLARRWDREKESFRFAACGIETTRYARFAMHAKAASASPFARRDGGRRRSRSSPLAITTYVRHMVMRRVVTRGYMWGSNATYIWLIVILLVISNFASVIDLMSTPARKKPFTFQYIEAYKWGAPTCMKETHTQQQTAMEHLFVHEGPRKSARSVYMAGPYVPLSLLRRIIFSQ
jgi:hypothetical protein